MNWEETIYYIRSKPEYKSLVFQSYLQEDLVANVVRFETSLEFQETLRLLNRFASGAKFIADIGAGNGISAAALAR